MGAGSKYSSIFPLGDQVFIIILKHFIFYQKVLNSAGRILFSLILKQVIR